MLDITALQEQIGQPIREVDLSDGIEIGRGQCAQIIKISDERAVKLYYESMTQEEILEEYVKTIEAQNLGLHCAKCFGMVSYKGRLGLMLELIKGGSIQDVLLAHPELAREYGRKMAEELKRIHSKTPDQKKIPPMNEFYLDCAEKCCRDGWINEEEMRKIKEFILAIPSVNSFLHGDYHFLNLMVHEGEVSLIDMGDCKSGHPVYDLMITNLYHHIMPKFHPEDFGMLFKITREDTLSLWDQFVRSYFATENERQIETINDILDVYSFLKLMLAPYSYDDMDKSLYSRFVNMGRQGLMPYIDRYTGAIPESIAELGKTAI